jgi:excisionase family DNA binding protein
VSNLAQLLADPARVAEASDMEVRQVLIRISALLTALSARIGMLTSQNGQPEAPAENLRELTVPKVAELLDLPRARVYELIRKGQIPAVRLGKNVRVPLVALRERFVQNQGKALDNERYSVYHNLDLKGHDRRGTSAHPKTPRADAGGAGRTTGRHPDQPRPLGTRRGADPGADGPIRQAPREDDDG